MCSHCSMKPAAVSIIETWADHGLTYTGQTVLTRPSAETYPNTYVFIFKGAVTVDGASKDVSIDVHYEGDKIEGGKARRAIGGLWMKGVEGAMKPEQHGGEILRVLKANLPASAPKPPCDGKYGAY